MIISIKEYIARNKECAEYEKDLIRTHKLPGSCFHPTVLLEGMLKWNDKTADNWGGPYPDNFVYCCAKDYSYTHDYLKTIEQLKLQHEVYEKYSTFNLVRESLKTYFPDIVNYYFILVADDENKTQCSRTTMTHLELSHYLNSATKEELAFREEKIKKGMKEKWENQECSVENPISLYLGGNDDCSYSRYYATKEEALNDVKVIENNMSWGYIHKNFIFTN